MSAHFNVISERTTCQPPWTVTPYCGIVWGSLPEIAAPTGERGTVYGGRAVRHRCFDRLVIDVHGPIAGHRVSYVDVAHRWV